MKEMPWNRFMPFLSKCCTSTVKTSTSYSSFSSSLSPIQPWLFVGLGNPGEKYKSTRHNVGFDMIDAFAQSQGIPLSTHYFKALFGEGMVDGVPVLLAKPQTYMNLSGESFTRLKSVIYHFRKNREFCRLRIGIGQPPGQMDPKAFVLQKFNRTGRERIDSAIREGVDILKMVATKGLTEAARLSNADQKYKHLRSHDIQTNND